MMFALLGFVIVALVGTGVGAVVIRRRSDREERAEAERRFHRRTPRADDAPSHRVFGRDGTW